MAKRHLETVERAPDCELLFTFYSAVKEFYPPLIFDEDVRKLLGLKPAGVDAAIKMGFIKPAHEGRFKIKQFALIDVLKLMGNRTALMKAARAGAEAIEAKNTRAKAARERKEASVEG